jgi:two-component system, cell cycle sensor histidine kinase and response regulator CckA
MNYSLKELLDIPRLRELFDSLEEIHNMPSAIVDSEGTILTATAWQEICTKFHRVNPNTEKKCRESDRHRVTGLAAEKAHIIYRCPMGLVDALSPIIIEGKHLGNVFVGQFFMEQPDKAFFIEQSRQYGFDEQEYLAALQKVPFFTEEKLHKNLTFIHDLTHILAEQGLQHKRQCEADEALRESEERFKSLSDATFGGIVIHDNGIILDCNQGLSDITGFTIKELVGMNGLTLISPDSLELVLKNIKSGFDQRYEVQGLRKDGTLFPLEVRGKTIPYKGQAVRVNEFRDITELKRTEEALRESEAHFRLLTENVADVVWKLDNDYRFTYISPADERLRGYKADEVIGHHIFELFNEEGIASITKMAQLRQEAEQRGEKSGPVTFEAQHRCKDGRWLWAEISSTPERDEDGAITGFFGISREITERKEYEKERLKIEKLESLSVLAGGIAHDFNNILAGIMGNISFAQIFLDATHKSHKPLVEAEKASVRATELAQQLLTFARGGEPVKRVVSLQLLVNETVTLVLHGSNVKGSVDISDSVHAIEADEGQMSQVFYNIIINATQAMPGGGTLAVTAQNETLAGTNMLSLPAGNYVRVTCTDQGCGISEDILKKVFDPYFTTKLTGNGLGLASVHSIISRHGGHISASSVVGSGSTFTMYLPSIGKSYATYQTDEDSQTTGDHMSGSILVMDDEEIIRNMTAEMLDYFGYQVTTCENGAEAIAQYNSAREAGTPFSAVIMDLTIPGGMGGKETADQILAVDPMACLIVSSGYSNDPIMSDFRTYGFAGAVAKPYNISEFGKLLSSVLAGR